MMKATEEKHCGNCQLMGNRVICDFFWIDEDEICDKYRKRDDSNEIIRNKRE